MHTHLFWKKALILLCISLLAHAQGCAKNKPPPLDYVLSDATILAFGDSLTHGSGTTTAQAYPAVLASLIQRKVVVEATPGDQTTAGLEKLPDALEKYQPKLLILCLGGNDFLRKIDPEITRANLQAMIEMAKAQNVPVVLIGVPKPALFGLQAHPMYQQLAKQYQLPLENEILAKVLSSRKTKSDSIHPNAQGYDLIAQALAKLLRDAGAV